MFSVNVVDLWVFYIYTSIYIYKVFFLVMFGTEEEKKTEQRKGE